MSDPSNSALPASISAHEVTIPKLTIFISYVHEDSGISDALNNLIQNAFGSDVAVFIDKVSIQQGEDIHVTIDVNLAKADILAVVSTNSDSPRYWAGYEIGFFEASHKIKRPSARPLWGSQVIFCSASYPPGPVADRKAIPLGFDSNALDRNQEDFDVSLKIADDDPLLLWFGELLLAITGEKLEERKILLDRYKSIIASFRKKVFAEFKQRPKFVFKPQKQLVIRFNSVPDHRFEVEGDAQITLLGNAHSVFGILNQSSSRTLTWLNFCNELDKAEGTLASLWIGTLVRMLTRAGKGDSLDETKGNLIWSQNEQKLFRLILTASTTYYNGKIEASIYAIEVLQRKDHGDPVTSLLAKALKSALRFRSLFLERNGLYNYLNIAYGHDAIADVGADIVAELDFLTMDLTEADFNKPAAYAGILTNQDIELMASTWLPLKTKLLENCKEAMASKPGENTDKTKSELAATLREINTKVGPLNDRFLKAVAAKLVEIAEQDESASGANPYSPGGSLVNSRLENH
jgi:uncharacterized protein Yka (UPF0111/DUF47 family)